jgi:hypothetical protein
MARHVMKAETGKFKTSGSSARMTTRYSFTAQYIGGSAILASRAAEIERQATPTGASRAEHRALVVGSVVQASSALETALAEILMHGPGHHLGTNGLDVEARDFIRPLGEVIDRHPGVLERWRVVLHVLKKPELVRGEWPYQDADLLVGLRNELVHYRSHWEGEMHKRSLLSGLRAKKFRPPAFVKGNVNDFPHNILGADCARWACQTAVDFLDHVYAQLGIRSILDGHRASGADLEQVIPPSRGRQARPAKLAK